MTTRDEQAQQLGQQALEHLLRGETEEAIALYEQALPLAESEDARELIVVSKAQALIAIDRDGDEVRQLPAIIMRRRSPRHVYIAATALMRRWDEKDNHKAIFYGEIARDAAEEIGDAMMCATTHNNLGIVFNSDSRFEDAANAFEKALSNLAKIQPATGTTISLRAGVIGNLGGTKILQDDYDEGIYLLNMALPDLRGAYAKAEACADLCLGYMQTERYDEAEYYGREALDLATVARQTRNANHLLGELMVRQGRYDEAEDFFDVVAGYYPQYGTRVRELLMSVDLCKVVNWKG